MVEEAQRIETAEVNDEVAEMSASIHGALKSQGSSNAERVKRTSAVRFADQVNLTQQESEVQ